MSGTSETRSRDEGLRAIAKQRYTDPMSSWPQHEPLHLRTLYGARMFDYECLRCHLEEVASLAAETGERK
jgi:hypothetical protein